MVAEQVAGSTAVFLQHTYISLIPTHGLICKSIQSLHVYMSGYRFHQTLVILTTHETMYPSHQKAGVGVEESLDVHTDANVLDSTCGKNTMTGHSLIQCYLPWLLDVSVTCLIHMDVPWTLRWTGIHWRVRVNREDAIDACCAYLVCNHTHKWFVP